MHKPTNINRLPKFAHKAVVIVALILTACATDKLSLAPSTPEIPWPIPSTSTIHQPQPDNATQSSRHPKTQTNPVTSSRPTQTISRKKSKLKTSKGYMPPENVVHIKQGKQYGLAELIDLAQRNNPETREAWEHARQAALAVGLAETSYLPQISAAIITGYQETPRPIPTTLYPEGYFIANTVEFVPMLAAKWLLFDFGKREGSVKASRENSFVANVEFTELHQKLIYAVSRDYFALGASRGRLNAAQQALETAEIIEDASTMRRANGLATLMEVTQAKRQTSQARFNLERAKSAELTAYTALIASMGVEPSTAIQVLDSTEEKLPDEPSGDVESMIENALSSRPDIIAALGKIRAAQANLSSARASYYPTISLDAKVYENISSLSIQGNPGTYTVNQLGNNILLKIDLPLFDGGTREANIAMAKSAIAVARASLDHARDAAVQQVTNAYDALKTGYAEFEAALSFCEAAQTAFDAALDAYRNGIGTYTDLANAEVALSQSQSEIETAHANIFTAAAGLAFATGSNLSQP